MRLSPRTTSLLLIGLTALAAAAPGMARDVSPPGATTSSARRFIA